MIFDLYLTFPMEKSFLFCILFAVVPFTLFSGGLIGFEGAEIYGHAWSYWWRIEAFPSWPNGTDLAHGTQVWRQSIPFQVYFVWMGQPDWSPMGDSVLAAAEPISTCWEAGTWLRRLEVDQWLAPFSASFWSPILAYNTLD